MIEKFYRYIIEKDNTIVKEYYIEFLQNDDIAVPLVDDNYSWASSNNFNCSGCPLKHVNEYCNLALHLSYFIDFFTDFNSYDNVLVTVQTNTYTITKATTIQQTALSILNLIIPFSGCPKFKYFVKAAKNHIPFETVESLLIRVFGFYSFELIRNKKALPVDAIDNFVRDIEQMHEPIRKICEVIRSKQKNDASINSLILLDSYFLIMSDMLEYGE